MAALPLTLACGNYDRTRALSDGRVIPEGIGLTYLALPVEETFFRMLRHREFEIAEMSLSSYVVSLFTPERPFVAIPVFPSRCFRHSCIYVHAGSDIRTPRDLAGRRVGNPEYQMTALVWIRGILAEFYDLPIDGVTYCTGGAEEPGRPEKLHLDLPARIRVEPIGPGQTLSQMLADGAIDALYTAREPSTFRSVPGRVRRLFDDFPAVERDYFRATGIFPIMHTVVIRRDVYEAHRWIAQALTKAFGAAQALAYADLRQTAAPAAMLPWLFDHVDETRRLMGDDYWPYGFERNHATLDTFLRYAFEQGLAKERIPAAALFAPETLERYRI